MNKDIEIEERAENSTTGDNSPIIKNNKIDGDFVVNHYTELSDNNEQYFVQVETDIDRILQTWDRLEPNIGEYLNTLNEHHIIYLSGRMDNLTQLAKLCACRLRDTILKKSDGNDIKNLAITELIKLEPNNRLSTVIEHYYKEGGIFILPSIQNTHLNQCAENIDRLRRSNYFFIIITNSQISDWQHIFKDISDYWITPEEKILFSVGQFRKYINKKIEYAKNSRAIEKHKIILNKDDWSGFSKDLLSFSNINEFVSNIIEHSKNEIIDHPKAVLVAKDILNRNDEYRVKNWFSHLSEAQQLIALGSCIFDGVFSRQYFSILDQLVTDIWRNRQLDLICFDYKDVKAISQYYHIVDSNTYAERIQSKSDHSSENIFSICWRSHRRYIISMLPLMDTLLKKSTHSYASLNTELYPDYLHRDQLRRSIAAFFTKIGCLSLHTIEGHLLRLIPEKNQGIRYTVASSLAQIYDAGYKNEVLELLGRWQHDKTVKNRLGELIYHNNEETTSGPAVHLQIAILSTILMISYSCPRNKIPKPLLALLFNIIKNLKGRDVRMCLETELIPSLLYYHFEQFKEDIYEFICTYKLTTYMPQTLAHAYENQPHTVQKLLNCWFQNTNNASSGKFTEELQLITIGARTLGFIRFDRIRASLNLKKPHLTVTGAYHQLTKILKQENHPNVREATLLAIIDLAQHHYEVVDEPFQKLMEALTVKERKDIVNHLSNIYIDERRQQKDGEVILHIPEFDEKFHVWVENPRPKMPIEKATERWLEKVTNTAAAQLAYLSEHEFFNTFDRYELAQIEKYKTDNWLKNNFLSENPGDECTNIELDMPSNTLTLYSKLISIPIGTIGTRSRFTKTLHAILPEALKQTKSNQTDTITRFQNDGRNKLAKTLKRVLWIEDKKNFLYILFTVLIIFTILISIDK